MYSICCSFTRWRRSCWIANVTSHSWRPSVTRSSAAWPTTSPRPRSDRCCCVLCLSSMERPQLCVADVALVYVCFMHLHILMESISVWSHTCILCSLNVHQKYKCLLVVTCCHHSIVLWSPVVIIQSYCGHVLSSLNRVVVTCCVA